VTTGSPLRAGGSSIRGYSDRVHLDFIALFDDQRIIEVFGSLHPEYQAAVILAYVYGYTALEISASTGAPLGTVLARLSRGRSGLRWRSSS
jgi:DNA-directed RNA polymerase specialized sigma24 family protein